MFQENIFLDRFREAKNCGFAAVEIQFPYDHDVDAIHSAKEESGVDIILINLGSGDFIDGGPGIAAHPDREDQFKFAVEEAYRYAEKLKPLYINVLAGCPPVGDYGRELCADILITNLNLAAETFSELNVKVLIEAVNIIDRPGFFLNTTAQSTEIINRVNHENIALQYDIYHMYVMEGNVSDIIAKNIDKIGHIQFSDSPGRHEPGTGNIDFRQLFVDLDKIGWRGWVGAEYVPSRETKETLYWLSY